VSNVGRRSGLVVTAIVALFFIFDAMVKLLGLPQAVDATVQLGYSADAVVPIGILEAVCLVLYLIPRTGALGAILLTGYLGGAVASHLRAGDGLFGFVLFPVYVGVLVWGALFLRDARVRALVPFTQA
jgi:hypothetical protein